MDNLNILFAGNEENALPSIASRLKADSRFAIVFVETADTALKVIRERKIDVAVVDTELKDITGLQLINAIVAENPFINCALVSSLPADEFHEETEGLGIFMQLPAAPRPEDADKMIALLEKIYSL